ncbi:MAG: DUF3301 domain-containing protein [Pseudomonadota bacterium]
MEWLLVALALTAWGWYSGAVAKEAAVKAAQRVCERRQRQLLDQTVALNGVRLRRDDSGRLRLQRRYGFEFSADGERRHRGEIVLRGQRLVASHLELDDHTLYEEEADPPQEPPC